MKAKLTILTVWHIFQIVLGCFLLGLSASTITIIHLIIGGIILFLAYLLFKRNRVAFILISLFLLFQSVSLNFPLVKWSFSYGLVLDIHIFDSPIGINPVTIIMLILLWSIRKEYSKRESNQESANIAASANRK